MMTVDEERVFDLSGGFRRDPAPLRDPWGDLGEALDAIVALLGAWIRSAPSYARRRPVAAALWVACVPVGGWLLWIIVLAAISCPR